MSFKMMRKVCLQLAVGLALSASVARSFSTRLSCRTLLPNLPTSAMRISSAKGNRQSLHQTSLHMSDRDSSLSTSSSLSSLKKQSSDGTQFVFVGGKGGVGKTSSSSAIAIALSDSGLRTLLVSTDPAHSLGDALDVNLRSGLVVPITTESNLWALEIDVDAALDEFKDTASGLDSETLAASFGVPKEIIETLGISDLASIFTNPPPGIDELVALTKIFQYADEKDSNGRARFDRIVIDTAPTGHTIRLLQLPEFLNSITGKLIKFRSKLMSAVDTFKGMFGGGQSQQNGGMGGALNKLESLQTRVAKVKRTLQNPALTQFVVVTIPTTLAVAESKRLVQSLQKEKIKVSSILCNQIITEDLGPAYVGTRQRAQRRCIEVINRAAAAITSGSEGYPNIEITEVPYIDTEVTGLYGLKYFSQIAHAPKPKTATNPMSSRKLTIFGGKGGVGKTTSAASWGVLLADSGLKTLVISTDPAHSLGDAFLEKLGGAPRLLEKTSGGGQLWAMEVDPETALGEFRDLVKTAMGPPADPVSGGGGGMMGNIGLPDFKGEITEMLSGVNDPPPGTDEVVAMTQIVTFLEEGIVLPNGDRMLFDRIVLDTAPTGHTLRMLQLPDFLQALMGKMKKIRSKAGGIGDMLGGMRGGNTKTDSQVADEDKLDKFEKRMERLEEILHNPKESEFTVVTIATEVASAETVRLLQSLKDESIAVRRLIINQVLPTTTDSTASVESSDLATNAYLDRLRTGQKSSIRELENLAAQTNSNLVQIPYFDMEVRTVYGLRVVGNAIFKEKK